MPHRCNTSLIDRFAGRLKPLLHWRQWFRFVLQYHANCCREPADKWRFARSMRLAHPDNVLLLKEAFFRTYHLI